MIALQIEGCAGKAVRLLNNIDLMKFVASLCGASQPIFAVSQVHPYLTCRTLKRLSNEAQAEAIKLIRWIKHPFLSETSHFSSLHVKTASFSKRWSVCKAPRMQILYSYFLRTLCPPMSSAKGAAANKAHLHFPIMPAFVEYQMHIGMNSQVI